MLGNKVSKAEKHRKSSADVFNVLKTTVNNLVNINKAIDADVKLEDEAIKAATISRDNMLATRDSNQKSADKIKEFFGI